MTQATNAGQPAIIAPPLGVALIRGRIVAKPRPWRDARTGDRRYSTLITLPAADEYSSAPTVEVQSTEPLGEQGDTWHGRVRLGGTARPFTYKDKNTGEQKNGIECTVRLLAVES